MASEPAPRPAAVLVHGLWMPALVMWPLQQRLERAGFAVTRFGYPSLRQRLDINAQALARHVAALGSARLVGHSLGGLVVLAALPLLHGRVDRAVLMGSPTAGCHCANFAQGTRALRRLVGRSLPDWFAAPAAVPAAVEVGIISGSSPWGLGRLIPGLPRPNDGIVAVAETRLAGARDAICLPVSHSQMLLSARCAREAANFLLHGRFLHD